MYEIERLKEIIEGSENIVFFGGAGVSTESGIPDFRGNGGLYTEEEDDGILPEEKLHISYFRSCPEGFYKYYKRNMIHTDAEPNYAHKALAELEECGKLKLVITQNIDGLHHKAGSRSVIELHGSALRYYCEECGREYPLEYILECEGVPYCEYCKEVVRPDVVLYGEALDGGKFYIAEEAICTCDTLIVAGSSLTVQPAASLIDNFMGENLVIINTSPTPYDSRATLLIDMPISEVFHHLSL